jgi:DNA-binding transcriptional ArsR family regulator
MSSIFPIRDTVTRDETREPRLIDLDEDTADEVFEALASQTTRQIFLALHEDPQTASDLAEETETSVQNVQYHLEKLTDIDLVEVADTWYSERGSEMKVYAPTDESLVLYAGRDKQTTFRSLLKRFTGVFSLLVPGSLLASWFASRSGSDGNTGSDPTQISGGDEYNVATGSEPEITSLDTADGGQYAPEDTEVAIAENGTADNGTASGDFTSLSPEDVEYSFESSADIFLSGNATDQPILITDGGNATAVPNGSTVQATSDTAAAAAGLDPALAAGVAFLLGGLLVAVALLAYYGVPE